MNKCKDIIDDVSNEVLSGWVIADLIDIAWFCVILVTIEDLVRVEWLK